MSTVTVEWTTTVEEYYTAEIDAEEWARIEKDGDAVNELARYEAEESHISSAVKERDVEGVTE